MTTPATPTNPTDLKPVPGTGKKGLFVIFGVPKSGKSTEAASALQDSLYIMSDPNLLHFYETWLLKSPQGAGLAMPKRQLVIDAYSVDGMPQFDEHGNLCAIPQKDTLEKYLGMAVGRALQAKAAGQPPPWRNLVIDEAGTFWARVYSEILPTCFTKKGELNPLAAHGQIIDWTIKILDLVRQVRVCGMNVCVVAHDQEPDPQNDKKGGPKFPNQSVMRTFAAQADGVFRRAFEDRDPMSPSARIWEIHGKQNWMTGTRGMPDTAFTAVRDASFAKVLEMNGFTP